MKAILLIGTHGRVEADGENHVYRQGDTIELNDDQYASLRGRVRIIGEPDAEPSLLDHNVAAVASAIENINDVSILEELAAEETSGKKRKGVLTAISDRIDELSDDED